MTTPSVEKLRKKYYAGDTSLEEERLLKQLLLAPDAPDDWKEEGVMMQQLSEPITTVPPAGFEYRLLKRLEKEQGWSAKKSHSKTALPLLRRMALTTAIAASIVGILFAINYYAQPALTVYRDTCQNPQEAKEEVENALLLVATTLSFDDLEDELGGPCE
jgi:hypothetical protein